MLPGTPEGIKEFKNSIVDSDESEENPYERIELYYPFKQLSVSCVYIYMFLLLFKPRNHLFVSFLKLYMLISLWCIHYNHNSFAGSTPVFKAFHLLIAAVE